MNWLLQGKFTAAAGSPARPSCVPPVFPALLDYKDGSFTPRPGGLAGLAMAIWRGWRQPPRCRAMLDGLLATAGAELASSALLGMRDAPPWPPPRVRALHGTALDPQR